MPITKNQTTAEFAAALLDQGFILRAANQKLRCLSIKGQPLTQEIAGELRNRKDSLMEYLAKRDIPLSFSQQRLWFLDQYEDQPTANYTIPMAFRLEGSLNYQALEQTFNELLKRHESLRTVFTSRSGEPCQVILDQLNVTLTAEDIKEKQLISQISKEAGKPYDLSQGPLLRTRLFKLSENNHVLMITQHHIISDGWSISLLLKEFNTLYDSFSNNLEPAVRPLTVQYPDYSLWQRQWMQGPELSRQLAFWKHTLQGYSNLNLPMDRVRPPVQGNKGKTFTIHFDPASKEAISTVCQNNNVTLYMFMLAAFNTLLYRYSSQEDIVIGSPVANRSNGNSQEIIGFFVNTLVFRTIIQTGTSFKELLQTVKTTCLQAYANQDLPFEKLVDELDIERDISRSPVFQIMLTLQDSSQQPKLELDKIASSPVAITTDTVKFDLTLNIIENSDTLQATFEYNNDLFFADTITAMADHFRNLVVSSVENSDTLISDLQMLSESDKKQLLVELNNTAVEVDSSTPFHALFEQQVEKTPDITALSYADQKLSYKEFNQKANQLARFLQDFHQKKCQSRLKKDTIIALCMERSLEMPLGIYGILKAGGAWVPVDPDYPEERIRFILEDTRAEIILTQEKIVADHPYLRELGKEIICLDTADHMLQNFPDHNLPHQSGGQNLAYLIYTSGSTGKPKGVMIEHHSLVNRILWTQDALHLDETDRILQKTPYSFDVSVWEFTWPLITGSQLVMAKPWGHKDPEYLIDSIEKHGITTLHFVPSMLKAFMDVVIADSRSVARLSSLKRILCSGEALSRELADTVLSHLSLELHNLYGPTEAAIDVSHYRCEKNSHLSLAGVPIGKPVWNTEFYILDKNLNPVPMGVPGELYITGKGLARGYLNREDLTEKTFINNPVKNSSYPRLYKSGDLVRYLPDGNIDYIGRTDFQVKIRGLRIELGEIEAVITSHPDISISVVVAHKKGVRNILVAYYVPGSENSSISSDNLRDHISRTLPDYMIPAIFIPLTAIPLTTSGKADRKGLPSPDLLADREKANYEAPGSDLEKNLARIWAAVLQLDRVGVRDNFFGLGGDSIMSIQVVSRTRELGYGLTPKQLFSHPTIADLAKIISKKIAVDVVDQSNCTGVAPLLPIQHWFFDQNLDQPDHFNQALLLKSARKLDITILQQTLALLIQHHDTLRLRYRQVEDSWEQYFDNSQTSAELHLQEHDLNQLAGEDLDNLEKICNDLQQSLDIHNGPVFTASVIKGNGDGCDRLCIVGHHLVIDGVSWRILLQDMTTTYNHLLEGKPAGLPAKTNSFQEWSKVLQEDYSRSTSLASQRPYWEKTNVKIPNLATDFSNDKLPQKADIDSITIPLSRETTALMLHKAPGAFNTGINDLLLTALLLSMREWQGFEQIHFDLEGHGREDISEHLDISRTTGWFTSLFPMLLSLPDSCKGEISQQTYATAIKAVKEQLRDLPENGIGYGILKYLSQGDDCPAIKNNASSPMMRFNYLGTIDSNLAPEGLFKIAEEPSGEPVASENDWPYLIDLNGQTSAEIFSMDFHYSRKHFKKESIQTLAAIFEKQLQNIISLCAGSANQGYTPSDFPLAGLNQEEIDSITSGRQVEALYPVSPMQAGLLFHALYAPHSDEYTEQFYWSYTGKLQTDTLKKVWQDMISCHPIFRTSFHWQDISKTVQLVHSEVKIEWQNLDWRSYTAESREARFNEYLEKDRHQGFDLNAPGQMRLHLIQMGDEEYSFVWTHHHILLDGWCLPLLMDEINKRYRSLTLGTPLDFTPPQPYQKYIQWTLEQDRTKANAYWREQLAGFRDTTHLAISNTKQLDIYKPITNFKEEFISCSADISASCRQFAMDFNVTINTLTQFAWAVVLHTYTGHNDIVVGATVSGRPGELAGVEKIIGPFVNALPLRIIIDNEASIISQLQNLHEKIQNNNSYSYLTLNELKEFTDIPKDKPLFYSLFAFQNYPKNETSPLGDLGLEMSDMEANEKTNYPLWLSASYDGILALRASYDGDVFASDNMARLLGHIQRVLERITANPQQKVSGIDIMSATEKQSRDTLVAGPTSKFCLPHKCMQEMFHQQVAASPDNLAIKSFYGDLTYRQLHEVSCRLGHKLISLGAKPNQLIGVLMEKGWQQGAACIGIQNSGAAYLPLNSDWPEERINDVLESGKVSIVLTHKTVLNRYEQKTLFSSEITAVSLDSAEAFSKYPNTVPKTRQQPEDLAYVIFTSGSTGKPKGVMINHIGAINTILDINMRFGVTEHDRVLAISALSFDLSVYDLFGPLYAGATVVYPDHEYKKDPSHWLALLTKENITLWNSVPPLMQLLVDQAEILSEDEIERLSRTLRVIMLSGDWIPPALPDRIKIIFDRPDARTEVIGLGGATEGSIWSIIYPTEEVDPLWVSIPYGKPMINQKMMVLDHNMGYSPINVAGEIYIGGAGVADGYWGNDEETLARFINHPILGEKVYRTGDLGRWLSNGNIEFLGRADNQVKIRGYRVELEDIETHIRQHPAVEYAIVMTRKDDRAGQELIACVSYKEQDNASEDEQADQVESWKLLYESTYGRDKDVFETSLNLAGWTSSYTGEPIDEDQMRVWVESTVARILALKPERVYEIGCGTGMLLFRVAPGCNKYVGTDFSETAIRYIQTNIEQIPQVMLQQREGSDFNGTAKADFDTVIINSVAQYFPSGQYLLQVIEGAMELLGPGGHIFLGDIRNFRLLDTYHASIEFFKAGSSITVDHLLKLVKKEVTVENELLVSPDLLWALPLYIPKIKGVKIFVKEGSFQNELTNFRYDAVLYTEESFDNFQVDTLIDWQQKKEDQATILESVKNNQPACLKIKNIVNSRLENDIALASLLFGGELDGDQEITTTLVAETVIHGLDPADFFVMQADLSDYRIEVTLSESQDSCFDVTFIHRNHPCSSEKTAVTDGSTNVSDFKWQHLVNTPASGGISTTELRGWLKESLPDYMIPSAFVVLDEMPLTANGKIDRKQVVKLGKLANIEHKGSEHFIAPRTDTEKDLCQLWESMLQVPKIGIIDNFFELGGHSLLVAEMAVAVKKRFGADLSFPPFMKNPTVEALAEMLDSGKSSRVSTRYLQQALDDAVLSPDFVKCQGPEANTENPETIMVTGAGGFLGCHLLKQLLEKTEARIYCQVRAKNRSTAIHKLKKNLARHNMADLAANKRLIVIHGDLARKNFHISGLDYVDLGLEVDSIYHCAAKVHHMYDYEMLRSDNVTATLRILELATRLKNKAIHYISTMGCIAEFDESGQGTENGPASKPPEEFNGYAMSKWVSEQLLWQARERGIHVKIYRPGNITGDMQTGACNPFFNHHLLMIKGSMQMGVIPDLSMEVEMTPVDILSKAIVGLSLNSKCQDLVYNLENPNSISWRDYITLLNNNGLNLKIIPYTVWKRLYLDKIDKDNALFALRMLYGDETGGFPSYHVERTKQAMQQIGLAFPDDYQNLISTYWNYNKKIGFIEGYKKND